jgi:hypothetical protein
MVLEQRKLSTVERMGRGAVRIFWFEFAILRVAVRD